jgi:hypothetical protein
MSSEILGQETARQAHFGVSPFVRGQASCRSPHMPLQQRTVRSAPSINADELADALLRLESGEELDDKSAELITDVVASSRHNQRLKK